MNAASMYSLNYDQTIDAISAIGQKRSVLVEGHMGTGKSSMLKAMKEKFPSHEVCYFDCTTKDLGDLMVPAIGEVDGESAYVRFVPNEELGIHLNKPVILMFDELGKANPAVKQGVRRWLLERPGMHPDSIVFATTNLGGEGVGDLMVAHQRNAITTLRMRKPDNMEWLEWAINNNIDPIIMGWVKDTPQLFHSFEEYENNPDDNPYIYHPRAARSQFVTGRSLEAASDWLKARDGIDNHTLTSALIGTIGDRAAMDLMAFITLADQLPSLEDIKNNPQVAMVPTSAAAVCMVVYRTLAVIEKEWMDAWMVYMERLDTEAQGLFANGVRSDKYPKRSTVMKNKLFGMWAVKNNYMFSADKL